ncbi:fanconi-associated nuclease 1 [Nematolebias whitei]|uniref:fanconi-associated nuclease 1 n=1 Tax=Nematolebias whitei TaxID=451745 RepID=UPI00189BEED4|nr:fanconi-associated nuclease 1 [Nematolebias whitei]
MTESFRGDKLKRSLSLSKKKKVEAGSSASSTTITSFFSSRPPPELACPLCGLLVPRFRINEHIDLQCHNFERGDSPSGSSHVVSNSQVPPRSSLPKSPELDHKVETRGTKTSPYFKTSICEQTPLEINKSVVRTIELGSLSSKLSRKHHNTPERRPTEDNPRETLSSSQKENVLIPRLEDEEVLSSSVDAPSCSETGHKASTSHQPSPSKLTKRKKGGRALGFQKKSKYEEKGVEPEQASSCQSIETTNVNQRETEVSSSCGPDVTSEETCQQNVAGINGDSGPGSGAAENQSSNTSSLPYYLRNFCTVLHAVLENEDDRALFSQDDMSAVHAFERLSVVAQKLYVRLFQRKLRWLQVHKLDYEEICCNLGPVAQELVQSGFLQTEEDLEDLGEALDLLPAPELKALAKTFHLGGSGTQKQQLVDGLLRLSKQKSFFYPASAQSNIGTVILRRAKQLAGSCVRLSRGPRAVFSRILLLFSLTETMDEEEMAAGGQNQLFTILLVNSGRLAFPDYTVRRMAKLFHEREDLIRYEASMRALLEVISQLPADCVVLMFSSLCSLQEELPVFLRSFTTGWAYTRILSRGVEILQRLHRYEEAVEELQSLLKQCVYCPDSRGRWWDRLALNLHQHLKKPQEAICAIRDGLSDPLVRTGHKLSLHQRALRMKDAASCKKYHLHLRDLPTLQVQDVKHVTIRGQLFPHEGGMGKSIFLLPSREEGGEGPATVICSVEELCLAHYRKQGFDQGIHGEGSTFSTLFALLMWDIIFMDGIPDVFRNPYQSCPLDLYTDCFYENRKDTLASRVQLLCEASVETLCSMLEDVWSSQEGKVCSLVSWERFSSLQQAQSLVACLGGAFLGGIVDRMAKDFRHCRAGLPDLVVWNSSNSSFKLVEVKGPNDRLSHKQQIWLDELQKLGADVEVCHVAATGARGDRLE